MLLFKKILTALALMGSVNAAALKKRINPLTSTCDTKNYFFWVSFSILIGSPYDISPQCDTIYDALEGATNSVSNWQCLDEDGFIRLWFNEVQSMADAINNELEALFQSIYFNCHDN